MHIPDGYLSPAVVVTTYAVALPLWAFGFKKLKEALNEETLPLIGALSALSFIIMMLNIPIPGGTSGHAVGAALIAILFNPWIAFIAISVVLLIQAVVFGDGGVSTFAANSLAMGFVGAFVGYYVFKMFKRYKFAPFLAGWSAVVASSFLVAFLLGIEPIFWSKNGTPLYFPFGLKETIPALVGAHMLFFGVVEALFTGLVYNYLKSKKAEFAQ